MCTNLKLAYNVYEDASVEHGLAVDSRDDMLDLGESQRLPHKHIHSMSDNMGQRATGPTVHGCGEKP